jgi:hypothetical protein
MSKLWMATAMALTLAAPAAFADFNDSTAEVNVKTPDITARGENYSDYVQRVPNSTTRTTTTTYTTTAKRGVGQANLGDEEVYRPYRSYTRVINKTPEVVTTTRSATYSSPDENVSMEQEADFLINNVENTPPAGEFVIIR